MSTAPGRENEFLLDQYKLYVEMTDRISSRRNDAAKFYTSLLTALLAIPFIILERGFSIFEQGLALLGIGILGTVLCFVWAMNINSYKQLASLRFKVIHEMEQKLPFHCYEREWEILNAGQYKYRHLNEVERLVPILLGLLFFAIVIVAVINLISR